MFDIASVNGPSSRRSRSTLVEIIFVAPCPAEGHAGDDSTAAGNDSVDPDTVVEEVMGH